MEQHGNNTPQASRELTAWPSRYAPLLRRRPSLDTSTTDNVKKKAMPHTEQAPETGDVEGRKRRGFAQRRDAPTLNQAQSGQLPSPLVSAESRQHALKELRDDIFSASNRQVGSAKLRTIERALS